MMMVMTKMMESQDVRMQNETGWAWAALPEGSVEGVRFFISASSCSLPHWLSCWICHQHCSNCLLFLCAWSQAVVRITCAETALTLHTLTGQSSLMCPGRLAYDLCYKALLISPANQWSVWPEHLPMCLVVIKIRMLQFKIRVYRSQLLSQFSAP